MAYLAIFLILVAAFATFYGVFKFEYELRDAWEGNKNLKLPITIGKLLTVAVGAVGILLLTAVIFFPTYQAFLDGTTSGVKEFFLNYLPMIAGAAYLFYLHIIRFSNLKNKSK